MRNTLLLHYKDNNFVNTDKNKYFLQVIFIITILLTLRK